MDGPKRFKKKKKKRGGEERERERRKKNKNKNPPSNSNHKPNLYTIFLEGGIYLETKKKKKLILYILC